MGAAASSAPTLPPWLAAPREYDVGSLTYLWDAAGDRHVVLMGEMHSDVTATGYGATRGYSGRGGGTVDPVDAVLELMMATLAKNKQLRHAVLMLENDETEPLVLGGGGGGGGGGSSGGGSDDDDKPWNPVERMGDVAQDAAAAAAAAAKEKTVTYDRILHAEDRFGVYAATLRARGVHAQTLMWDVRTPLGLAVVPPFFMTQVAASLPAATLAAPATPALVAVLATAVAFAAHQQAEATALILRTMLPYMLRTFSDDGFSRTAPAALAARAQQLADETKEALGRGHDKLAARIVAFLEPLVARGATLEAIMYALDSDEAPTRNRERADAAARASDTYGLLRLLGSEVSPHSFVMVVCGKAHAAVWRSVLNAPGSPYRVVAASAMLDDARKCKFPSPRVTDMLREVRARAEAHGLGVGNVAAVSLPLGWLYAYGVPPAFDDADGPETVHLHLTPSEYAVLTLAPEP